MSKSIADASRRALMRVSASALVDDSVPTPRFGKRKPWAERTVPSFRSIITIAPPTCASSNGMIPCVRLSPDVLTCTSRLSAESNPLPHKQVALFPPPPSGGPALSGSCPHILAYASLSLSVPRKPSPLELHVALRCPGFALRQLHTMLPSTSCVAMHAWLRLRSPAPRAATYTSRLINPAFTRHFAPSVSIVVGERSENDFSALVIRAPSAFRLSLVQRCHWASDRHPPISPSWSRPLMMLPTRSSVWGGRARCDKVICVSPPLPMFSASTHRSL